MENDEIRKKSATSRLAVAKRKEKDSLVDEYWEEE